MYWSWTFVLLKDFYSMMIVVSMIKFGSTESILDKTWLNHMEHLTAKIDDHDLYNKTIDSHPLNEGFILLSDNHKKSTKLTNSSNSTPVTYTTTVMVKSTRSTPRLIGHRSRRLLYELNSDSDTPTIEDNAEINQFLKVNDVEELTKQLINLEVTVDGSGDTTEATTETTTTETSTTTTTTTTRTSTTTAETSTTTTTTTTRGSSTTASEEITLSGNSTFIITVDCTNALAVLNNISEQLNKTLPYWYVFRPSDISTICARALNTDVTITILTDSNITILTSVFRTLANIVSSMGIELKSVDKCGTNGIVIVQNVTSCYLINLCNLCGTNPPRGVCLPEKNLSKCECFINENNPSLTYTDEFCKIPKEEPLTSSSSLTSIIIGVLAGVAGLFFIIIIFILVMNVYRRRRNPKQKKSNQDSDPLWHIPISTSIVTEDPQRYLHETHAKQLEQVANQIKTQPNTPDILTTTYDPIIELDAIIDDESSNIFDPNYNLLR